MINIPDTFEASADQLKGKIILVSGATGGFGKVVSKALAQHGASVILLAKNLRLVEKLYDEIEQAGFPTAAIYPMNLEGASEQDYEELGRNVANEFGRLDGLIHCAAILGVPTVFEHSDSASWYQVHQVNLHAPYLLTRACLPLLKQSANASLLFMTDDKPGAYWDAYQVSKKAVEAMAGLLAREYQGSHLRVNCFNPGKTRTELHMRAYPAADENQSLADAQHHIRSFIYFMSDELKENGEVFTASRSAKCQI